MTNKSPEKKASDVPAALGQAPALTIKEAFESVGGWYNGGELGYPSFGSADALRVYTIKMQRDAVRLARSAAPSNNASAQDDGAVGDTCAEMRALCSSCGGAGDVHGIDGEWHGECACPAGVGLALERLKIAGKKTYDENEQLRAALASKEGAQPDDVRNQALEEAAELAVKFTAVPCYVHGKPTAPMKTRAYAGEIVAAAIRALKTTASASNEQGGAT